jgi:hypothetical protein
MSGSLRLWLRTSTVRTESYLLIPLGVALTWHFAVAAGYRDPGDLVESPYIWGTLYGKFLRLNWNFLRFGRYWDELMPLVLVLCLLLQFGRIHLRELVKPEVLEMLVLGATFLAMYVALPMGYSEAWFVDVRPLPLATLFLVMACLHVPSESQPVRSTGMTAALTLAVLLTVGNLAYLTIHLTKDDAWLAQYRAVIAAIPRGARVLSVYTRAPEGRIVPFLHVDAFAVIDREVVIPYLFCGNTGSPMKYFRYVHRPYAPVQPWYVGRLRNVDWHAIAGDYDFLLVTKPFDPTRLATPTTIVAENESAALLALVARGGPKVSAERLGMFLAAGVFSLEAFPYGTDEQAREAAQGIALWPALSRAR